MWFLPWTQEELKTVNADFTEILDKWNKTGDTKYFDKMWKYVYNAVAACIKGKNIKCKAKGGYGIPHIDDKIGDITVAIMSRLQKRCVDVQYLSGYCSSWCLAIYKPNLQLNESSTSYDLWQDNMLLEEEEKGEEIYE